MDKPKIAVAFCVHDDHWYLETALESFRNAGDLFLFVSRLPWNGEPGDWQRVQSLGEKAGATVLVGNWPVEVLHRAGAVQSLIDRGYTHAFMPDTDEVAEPLLIDSLLKIAGSRLAQRVYVHMDTYWKRPDLVIRPRERLMPLLLMELDKVVPADGQMFNGRLFMGGKELQLPAHLGVLHHLSYAGPDERIRRKITTWSHSHEVQDRWWNEKWLGWDDDHLMRDLHPTHPPVYGCIERIPRPEPLQSAPDYQPERPAIEKPKKWPKVSIVIPLYGGVEEIKQCLDSLSPLTDLIHETIVVDDVSPDEAAFAAAKYPFVKLLRNETNSGFAATCNAGYRASSGEVVFFLNSDTIVPRAGLIRLIECLMGSGTIGAAGPVSNNVGYYQPIPTTYSGPETIDLLADDVANSNREDRDVEMLVGFALAVRRSVLEEVGVFDERFVVGMFEDTDLCYRIARAGYSLRIAGRAFVHHWGSRTMQRSVPDPVPLLHRNGEAFRAKWQRDLETGFASHLPGFNISQGLVRFDKNRHPDRLAKEIARLREQADISLCMIVKNEERVLGACLESAKPYFKQVIVVDTGSTDRTVEIAKEHGAELYEIPWPDSFAEARNESLKHATGKWIFWCDADDTLPFATGEKLLHAALSAPREIAGYIIPVQFVEDGPGAGTRVDHVKLLRNKPDIRFEGRIHEQILAPLRRHGDIARIDAVVLHSGYDTSPAGQTKKRERDWKLLELDLKERPEHPFVLFNIGMTHHFTNGHEEAIEWLRKSINHSGETDSHLRKCWSMMGVSYRELGLLDEAEAAFREGLGRVGEDPELSFQLAMTLSARGRFAEAIYLYESMPTGIEDHFSSVDIGILTFKRLHNLATARYALGDYSRARADWLEARRINPSFLHSVVALSEAATSSGDYRTAREALDQWLRTGGPSQDWAEQRARLADESGEPGGSLQLLGQLIQESPGAVGPRLILARKLLAMQQVDLAIPQLEILERQNVAEAAFFLGVAALQRDDLPLALAHTERAVQLNPGHPASQEQLQKLREALNIRRQSVLTSEEQKELLTGPHAGKLGEATKRFSVVIVTYNSANWIEPCLASVLPTLDLDDEVVVIDNASGDDTVTRTKALKDVRIKVVKNKENVGYSRAANQGMLKSKGQTVVLLNPDTLVSPGWLEGMANHLAEGVGAVGPVSDAITGQQFAGLYLRQGTVPPRDRIGQIFAEEFSGKSIETKLIIGMCVMMPRAVLDAHGLLDEVLVLGADDLEFSWRLRSLGYKLVVALDVFVCHEGHASFNTRPQNETAALIAASDKALVEKLQRFYGPILPNSFELWSSSIFDDAFATNAMS